MTKKQMQLVIIRETQVFLQPLLDGQPGRREAFNVGIVDKVTGWDDQ